MKKVAVIGGTGYAGQELIRLLLQHGGVEIHAVTSQSYAGAKFNQVYPSFNYFTSLTLEEDQDLLKIANQVDLIFLALPHSFAARKVDQEVLKQCCVIDIGADFRLKKSESYKEWYGEEHANPDLLSQAVYGLPELNRDKIALARLIANPGCYATCAILAVAPLLSKSLIDPDSIIIDAKSGVSGAGRSTNLGVHFTECNETLKAYKVASHRHTPEIEQVLSGLTQNPVQISFTPHLVPMNRGILVTAYASLNKGVSKESVFEAYRGAYEKEDFIRLFDGQNKEYPYPETRWVKGSNFCDIGMIVDQRTNRVIVISAIDNLVKGAAGQAIQNMNIVFGIDEFTGLEHLPIFPA